ncbi:hypothetical protein 000TH008_60 [Bacillus phage 000TH008]|nr:hypothetical protein 000TH008_60 [Bacillus phage 000TH008]QQO40754.1 hypothetical protein 000TH009_60 [Bacillus phage 000TH009]
MYIVKKMKDVKSFIFFLHKTIDNGIHCMLYSGYRLIEEEEE